jgi:hypothetical protein
MAVVRLRHPVVKGLYEVLLSMGFEGAYILDVVQDAETLKAKIKLPVHADLEDFEQILQNLKMEIKAMDVKIGDVQGKKVEVIFGMCKLESFVVRKQIKKYLKMNSLKILLPSSYGCSVLDFEDGASCHMLNGGKTRMGKTCLLLYLCCLLYIQNKKIEFVICSSKIKDFYPLYDLPRVSFAENEYELIELLDRLTNEFEERGKRLKRKELRKATDAKSVRKYYPKEYRFFSPIFLIIDEYADYSHFPEIQKSVENLVRKAGYVNIHVIISTQRADARTTIPPQIKCNLSARICFTTTDKNNSIVILDEEGAEKLGSIEGRAIFLDGGMNIVQVPFMDAVTCDKYLSIYRKGRKEDEQNGEGPTNSTLSNKVQNLFTESVSGISIQGEHKPSQCNKQGDEKNLSGWWLLASSKDKR